MAASCQPAGHRVADPVLLTRVTEPMLLRPALLRPALLRPALLRPALLRPRIHVQALSTHG
jgi:hypothetical protein